MLNLFNLKRLSWGNDTDGKQKVALSATEVESIRSELADLEEREAHLKARLEHIDEILRSARLSGYLQMRTRWTALPGEPLPLDDSEVDDWLPRFVVLQGPCIFLYFVSTDISPQDSSLLSDVVEVGRMPCHTQEDGETQYRFYMVTRQGLRYECSSASKLQVDAWVATLQDECKMGSDSITLDHLSDASNEDELSNPPNKISLTNCKVYTCLCFQAQTSCSLQRKNSCCCSSGFLEKNTTNSSIFQRVHQQMDLRCPCASCCSVHGSGPRGTCITGVRFFAMFIFCNY